MSCGSLEQRGDTRHFSGEDRIPALQELRVGDADPEQAAQCGEEFGFADLSPFVPLIGFIARGKSPCQMCRVAVGVVGPARKRLFEIDIEHHAAEIEQ